MIPKHYFSRFLFKKDRKNIRDYFPSKILYNIKPYFNEKELIAVIENKLYFNFFFSQFNISHPKIILYNNGNVFFYDKEAIIINSIEEFKHIIKQAVSENNISESLFIKKTYGSYGGDNVYKVFIEEFERDTAMTSQLFNEVINSSYLFQETIKQHSEMNKLNPSCVNTLRLESFISKDGSVELINGYLRTSLKGHYVDNISAGGCRVALNLNTGQLVGDGFMSLKDGGINVPTEHPVTHVKFDGFKIPFFMEAKNTVIRAAGYMPGLRLVGWDVAIAETGPVLIEGNPDFDMANSDLTSSGLRSNPVFRKVLEEINYL
jgi:hypothetical protein